MFKITIPLPFNSIGPARLAVEQMFPIPEEETEAYYGISIVGGGYKLQEVVTRDFVIHSPLLPPKPQEDADYPDGRKSRVYSFDILPSGFPRVEIVETSRLVIKSRTEREIEAFTNLTLNLGEDIGLRAPDLSSGCVFIMGGLTFQNMADIEYLSSSLQFGAVLLRQLETLFLPNPVASGVSLSFDPEQKNLLGEPFEWQGMKLEKTDPVSLSRLASVLWLLATPEVSRLVSTFVAQGDDVVERFRQLVRYLLNHSGPASLDVNLCLEQLNSLPA